MRYLSCAGFVDTSVKEMARKLRVQKPFKDKNGDWWIYRADDESKNAGALPLGPFFEEEYAEIAETMARIHKAPIKLFGRKPVI